MSRYICIHGHFYQPPRENPWLEEIEWQDSSYPYHDWNERIMAECYAPNTASRILDSDNRIINIVNNYAKISFNFGPTLLSWMEKNTPNVYQSLLKADQDSQKNFSGHGSAIAQAYNHMILPLANSRDKRTQIIWGIKDFEYRFKRKPEGLWLAETAVDIETLDIMAECGIIFTILAPRQAHRIRKISDKKWKDVSGENFDPKRPYVCNLPSGRSINLFFYDGPISRDIAFGDLLKSGDNLAKRMLSTFAHDDGEPGVAHIATDGETYGHHHRYGEMALAYCLHFIESQKLAKLTIYGEFLEKFPPAQEVEIYENSSWSCAHGVERWRSDCGCNVGSNPNWNQKWREPLRKALDWLRDQVNSLFEKKMYAFTDDPWGARDQYIRVVLNRSIDNVEKFFKDSFKKELEKDEKRLILQAYECQRNAMLMYTSCGWFFDEVSGLETTQILCYALRVIQLAQDSLGVDLEKEFVERLQKVPSNLLNIENGAVLFEKQVKPALTDLMRAASHYSVLSLFESYSKTVEVYSYTIHNQMYERFEVGKQKLAIGKIAIHSNITWKEATVVFALLHLGDHNIVGGVISTADDKALLKINQDIKDVFRKNDIPSTIRLIERHYEKGLFSLWHLFRDEQRRLLYQILGSTLIDVENSLRQINEYHYPIIQVVKQLHIPLPKLLANTVVVMLNKDLLETFADDRPNFKRLEELVSEVKEWSLEIDKITLGHVIKQRMHDLASQLVHSPFNIELVLTATRILRTLEPLNLNLDLWRTQNIYFSLGKMHLDAMKKKADNGDHNAKMWIDHFLKLGEYLRVKIV